MSHKYDINVTVENILEFSYNFACFNPSDINEHILVLTEYANLCEHITEFGTRKGMSTWAWLGSKAKTIRCFDVDEKVKDYLEPHILAVKNHAPDKDFTFTCVNTIADKLEIEPTDLLFIDTDHTYEQCSKELQMHAHKVKKYLIFHDTALYQELNKAINEFLEFNKEWKIKEVLLNNNGLTVLERTT
jgi:predicted O-methyltransferase YrrM